MNKNQQIKGVIARKSVAVSLFKFCPVLRQVTERTIQGRQMVNTLLLPSSLLTSKCP